MEEIKEKVEYCLNCPTKPCSNNGCPLNNNIPNFIQAVKNEDIKKAYKIISEMTVLPGLCGRICPHKKQCEGSCVRGIKGEPVRIGEIESYIFDKAMEQGLTLKEVIETSNKLKGKKVAIIGGGPAGLTCSAFLAKEGADVTIYERYNYLGGLLVYGIPEFRLSKDKVKQSIDQILSLGIKVEYNKKLGDNLNLEYLKQEYDAIFLSIGANKSCKLEILGEDLQGVYGGNELLEYDEHPDYTGKIVSVIGGGNVAIDCARTIKRKGAKKVQVIYRRAREQMPAEDKEIEDAIKEGIEFLYQNNILEIKGKGKVEKLELIKTELKEKPGETRLVPVNIEKSNYKIETDYLVTALGSKPSEYVKNLGLELNKWGNVKIDEYHRTSDDKVYAGGDIAGEKSTVAWAARAGRETAKSIIEKLTEKKI